MTEIITALQGTPLTTFLVVGGIGLIVLALAGGFSGKIEIPPERQRLTGIIGTILLVSGIALYLYNPAGATTEGEQPAPTITVPPTPTAAPATQPAVTTVRFEEDNRWDTGQFNDTTLQIERGQYVMEVRGAGQHAWSLGNYTVTDGTFSLEAALLDGDPTAAYGIIWRADSADDFYMFLVSADGNVRIARCLDKCNELVLFAGNDWFPSDAIRQGTDQTNILSVEADGNRFRFFVNGEEIASGTDDSRRSGRIGVALFTSNGELTSARFDNYTITTNQ